MLDTEKFCQFLSVASLVNIPTVIFSQPLSIFVMKMTTLLCSELIMYCEIRLAADDYLFNSYISLCVCDTLSCVCDR